MTIDIESPERDGRMTTFRDGSSRTVAELPSVFFGKGVYLPGWRWSEHVARGPGSTAQHHIGYVQSGRLEIRGPDGETAQVGPGDAFEITAGHDARVIGDEPCVALDVEVKPHPPAGAASTDIPSPA